MLGEKIAKFRKEKGWTQRELALIAGISEDYISDIERGKVYPRIKTLAILAKCLGIELKLLLRDSFD